MIIVTGSYGFIGSKFVRYLNSIGRNDIIVCDYLDNGRTFVNLAGAEYASFIHPDSLLSILDSAIDQVFHFGAISDTACWDGKLVMSRNYQFSVDLILACDRLNIPISYSSSASVYGNGTGPLNLYAYSKFSVDKFVTHLNSEYVQGFRYFNVYSTDGAEWHKGDQASPYYKFANQALTFGRIEIFEGSENFYRDFVHVDTVCEIQYDMSQREISGIFDLGSGKQTSFLEVANEIAKNHNADVVTIPFPEHLKGCYQTNTLANMDYYKTYRPNRINR